MRITFEAVFCDRCGFKVQNPRDTISLENWGRIKLFGMINGVDLLPANDLCPSCVTKFEQWWRAGGQGKTPAPAGPRPKPQASGGRARAVALSPERRAEISKKAANARWSTEKT